MDAQLVVPVYLFKVWGAGPGCSDTFVCLKDPCQGELPVKSLEHVTKEFVECLRPYGLVKTCKVCQGYVETMYKVGWHSALLNHCTLFLYRN